MQVPEKQRQKLDDRIIPCIVLGYGDTEFAYRLWDPMKKKDIRSNDVIFNEYKTLLDFNTLEKITSEDISIPTLVSPSFQDTTDE